MNTITIRAADAAHALDEALRRLGPDALILTTRQIEGRVEVTAATPEPALPIEAPPPPPPPVASGFSAHLLRQLAAVPAVQGVLPPHLPPRIVLAGPPGAGRSLLAARLAAACLRSEGSARPHLIAPRSELFGGPGRLALHARLMGIVADHPVWRPGHAPGLAPPHPDECQIVDLSGTADAVDTGRPCWPCRVRRCGFGAAHGPTALHDRYVETLFGHVACVVLTRTDLFPPPPKTWPCPPASGWPSRCTRMAPA